MVYFWSFLPHFAHLLVALRQKKAPYGVLFSTKSTLAGGINRIHDEIPLARDEIRLDGGWVDLISSK